MRPVPPVRSIALAALAALAGTGVSFAQAYEPPSVEIPFHFDSGVVENAGSQLAVVCSFPVHVENTAWMQLHFASVELSGHPARGTGSFLRITSMTDGAVQTQDGIHVEEWEKHSAYFNGDAVLVEVLAYPNTGPNHVVLRSVTVATAFHDRSQCGGTDDRVLSLDPRAARLMTMGCTSWLIDDAAGCLLTAGHCGVNGSSIVEFNVPLSTTSGTLQHPGPEDQYSVDPASVQSNYIGIGNDYAYFGVFDNPVSGLPPAVAQGQVFNISLPPSYSAGQLITITGYGVDYNNLRRTQVQQTNTGDRLFYGGSVLEYIVDTEGGNSGSPVIYTATDKAIGIHTNGGCSPPSSGNLGTGLNNAGLQAVLATPLGGCDTGLHASFAGSPRTGTAPLSVAFSDTSQGTPITWAWTFGDGGTDSVQNPTHVYLYGGTYTVSLTVSDGTLADTETRYGYIVVDGPIGAAANSYNGSGTNPAIFQSTSLPVLGTNWTSQIDGGSIGASGPTYVAIHAGFLWTLIPGWGELLIDPNSPWLYTSVAGGGSGISVHGVPIPGSPTFAGVKAYAQGVVKVGTAFQLTNAWRLTLGY